MACLRYFLIYLTNILLGVDQLLNCLVGGEPDESLSSHAYRMHRDGKPWGFLMWLIDILALVLFWQTRHCFKSYQSEIKRLQLAPEFRE